MKWFVALVLVLCCGVVPGALGQGLDDEYIQIFKLIQEADTLNNSAPSQALAKYLDAQGALDRLHKGSPDWNTKIVNYRLTYLADRIAALSATSAPSPAAQRTENPSSGVASSQSVQPVVPADWQAQLVGLQDRIGQLQSEKALLEAKLKEALAMRPAAADPVQMAKAEAKIKELQKENDLLKVDIEKGKQAPAPAVDSKGMDAQAQIAKLQSEKESMRLEKVALENRVKQLTATTTSYDASAATVAAGENVRVKQLESERDALQKQLDAAIKEKAARKGKAPTPRVQDLEKQLALEKTRLEVLEARAVPYTSEELELLQRPQTRLAEVNPKSGKKSIKELPAGSAALVAEAQRYFAAKQYDKAEAAYLQVLQQDPKNVPTLANLAAILMEAGQFDKAESNIKQALALEPEDAYCLYVMGILRFRQGRYDEALDALSRSAKLDPQNAEVQNYLGLALSEKGQRAAAEAALRKAIQLQPGYAGAHYNLAVVYATQQPPATELARWHYQKAIAAGHSRNPDLEKRFEVRQ